MKTASPMPSTSRGTTCSYLLRLELKEKKVGMEDKAEMVIILYFISFALVFKLTVSLW